jgi:hypothetical protein
VHPVEFQVRIDDLPDYVIEQLLVRNSHLAGHDEFEALRIEQENRKRMERNYRHASDEAQFRDNGGDA